MKQVVSMRLGIQQHINEKVVMHLKERKHKYIGQSGRKTTEEMM